MSVCHYTALGDSLTRSLATSIFYGFSFQLADFLEKRCGHIVYENLGKPRAKSKDLLLQLEKSASAKHAVENADIITITIGGNDLLQCTYENYHCLDKNMASAAVIQFRELWPGILTNIRSVLYSQADIYVMLLYNPYYYRDKIYTVADYYIREINGIIADPVLISMYGYEVVDIYSLFERHKRKNDLLIHSFIRDPHPNWKGFDKITHEFIKCIGI